MAEWIDHIVLEFRDAARRLLASLTIYSEGGSGSPRRTILRQTAMDAEFALDEPVQLLEDCRYSFKLTPQGPTKQVRLLPIGNAASSSRADPLVGRIDTRSEAGLLTFDVEADLPNVSAPIRLSKIIGVRPVKFDPVEFRSMLDQLAEFAVDVLLSLSGSSQLRLRPSLDRQNEFVVRQFFLLRTLMNSDSLQEILLQIQLAPHQLVRPTQENRPINRLGRINPVVLRQFASLARRIPVPASSSLATRIASLPQTLSVPSTRETVDTAENRFVKFCLMSFCSLLTRVEKLASSDGSGYRWLGNESSRMRRQLQAVLDAALFRDVSEATFLPVGSPVLQRRPGYRDLLSIWLRFNSAASLAWDGVDDIFGSGKKDTDKLYEYWIFCQLVTMLTSDFCMPRRELRQLFEVRPDGTSFRLKSGNSITITWRLTDRICLRPLNMRFSYNKTFSTSREDREGTWTRPMRPDYTLSWWPVAFSVGEAEAQGLIVHVHFDSKYRVKSVTEMFGSDDVDLDKVTVYEKMGTYHRADLHKMYSGPHCLDQKTPRHPI